MTGCPLHFPWAPMPHKHNADRRHHIPKLAFKVENWPEYEAGLRLRGNLTLWIEDGALDRWQTLGPGGQARYADAAIQTTLMVRTAFKLALRQTEGLLASVITLMDPRISVPDHTTISRRAATLPVIQADSVPHGPLHLWIDSTGLHVYGAGQWLEAKHGAKEYLRPLRPFHDLRSVFRMWPLYPVRFRMCLRMLVNDGEVSTHGAQAGCPQRAARLTVELQHRSTGDAFCVQGVITPLLSNLYLNEVDRMLERLGRPAMQASHPAGPGSPQ